MRYVLKIHIECESELKSRDLEQVMHNRIREETNEIIKMDEENTFVVAVEYNEYHKPEHTD